MRKLISTIAGFVLIIAIFLLSFIVIIKKNLTVENLSNTIRAVYESRPSYSDDYFIKLVNGTNTKDTYKKFFDNEEIEDLYITYFSEYVLYANGVPGIEKPEFNDLKNKVDGYLEDYETQTGLEADRTQSFKFFYDLDENMAKTAFISNKVKKIMPFIYNKNVKNIIIAVILVCIVIMIIFNRETMQILLHISSVFISNGIGVLILKILIDKYSKDVTTNDFLLKIMNNVSVKFTKIYIICFVIGFGALLIFLLTKIFYRRKDKPEIKQITEAALPGYMTNELNQTSQINQMNQVNQKPVNTQLYKQDSLDQFNNMGGRKD